MNTRHSYFRSVLMWLVATFAIALIGISTVPAAEHADATLSPESAPPSMPTTTWLAGDRILYRQGCHSLENMQAAFAAQLAQRSDDPAYAKCFSSDRPIPAILGKREAHLSTPLGTVSFWRIWDATNATEWIVLPDAAGPHRNNHTVPARYRPFWSAKNDVLQRPKSARPGSKVTEGRAIQRNVNCASFRWWRIRT